MRRITLWVLSTISTLVLLFSYHTSTSSTARAGTSIIAPQTTTATGSTATGSTTTGGSASGTTASGTGSTSAAATGSGSTATSGATAASETVDGSVVSTRFGNVQVQITKSVVLQVPWNNQKDQQINARAVPTLNSEAVKAQSADIDMVSGATYTSEAYLQSLQSAIDRAHLS